MNLRIEKLLRGHAVEGFDCGREALNRFLIRYTWQNQQAGASQTYIALADEQVAGYYTLVVGPVEYDDASERLKKGLARHPVPIMLLARLAVSARWQGMGLGSGLLKDAMLPRYKPPRSPVFGRSPFTPRTMAPRGSTSASTSSLRPPIRIICFACSRTSGRR